MTDSVQNATEKKDNLKGRTRRYTTPVAAKFPIIGHFGALCKYLLNRTEGQTQ